jgi:hypothetical protein
MDIISTKQFLENYIIKGNIAIDKLNSDYFIQYKNEIDKIEDKETKNGLFIEYLLELYHNLNSICLLSDFVKVETLNKYNFNEIESVNNIEDNNKSIVTDYIISSEAIDYIINKNIEGNIIIRVNEPTMIYYIIDYYLSIQVFKCLLEKYRIINTESRSRISISSIKQSLYNIRNRKEYESKKVLNKSVFDDLWADLSNNEIINKQLNITYEEFYRTILSKTDYLLLPILLKFITFNDKYSDNAILEAMFPLFCYLMPHKKWCKSDSEFMLSEDGAGKNYREYKISKMRRFINKK